MRAKLNKYTNYFHRAIYMIDTFFLFKYNFYIFKNMHKMQLRIKLFDHAANQYSYKHTIFFFTESVHL